MRTFVCVGAAIAIFVLLNLAIVEKERIKEHGQTVLLQLAPVDPRSLMQGDYMRLRWAMESAGGFDPNRKHGYVVISVGPNDVAKFVRFHDGRPLASDEKLLRFHARYGQIRIVPDSFFFQEGHASHYQRARYGIFKFGSEGESVLVGLADEKLAEITPPAREPKADTVTTPIP